MAEALEVGAVLLDENSYSVGDDGQNSYSVGANREKLLQRRSKTPTVEELRTEVPPLSESNKKVTTKISSDLEDDESPVIPLAAPTTQFVEVETFDSDDNGKTIVVERRIPRKSWNNAVKIWRNDESKFARVEFEDEPGKMTSIRPSQLKSWNVRPKVGGSMNQYNGGTAFQG